MNAMRTSLEEADFFNLRHAKWTINVLGLLIAVVGQETLVGLILRQARAEIASVVRDEEPAATTAKDPWYLRN
jgi:hypothetical protein